MAAIAAGERFACASNIKATGRSRLRSALDNRGLRERNGLGGRNADRSCSARALIRRAPLSINSPCRYFLRGTRFVSERFALLRSSMIGTDSLPRLDWVKM